MAEAGNYLTKEEIRKFLGVIKDTRDRAIFRILYFHGLRASEIGALQMSNYDPVEKRLLIKRKKGSRTSNPELGSEEVRYLNAWLRERGKAPGPIFRTSHKKGIHRSTLHLLVRKYAKLAGIPIEKAHAHIFKHSIATHHLRAGTRLEQVQRILGHKKITSTEVYLHIADSEIDEAARKFAEEW